MQYSLIRVAIVSSLLAALLQCGPAVAADDVPAPEEFAAVRERIQSEISKGVVPALSVAVVRNDRLVWAQGFGHSNLEDRTPATSNTIYRLASISKPLTATGLMKLVDRGAIDLDAPANQYLPGPRLRTYLGSANEMTIRRIANHTSGLPIHYNFFYDGVAIPSMDETIRRYGFASKTPGSGWEYSNLGFGILNYITATVAGTLWGEFMEQEVYDPLGMSRTSDRIRPGRESDAAVQYGRDLTGRFFPVSHYEFDHPGASVIVSTVQDLARFARLHMNAGQLDGVRILSPEATQQMQVKTSSSGSDRGYGIAWAISTYRGQRSIAHSGGMPGVSTILRLFPDDKSALVVLTNSDRRNATTKISEWIGKTLYDGRSSSSTGTPTDETPRDLDGNWKGTLAHHDGEIAVSVCVKGEKIRVRLGNGPLLTLQDARFVAGELRGHVAGRIPTQPTYHGNSVIRLRLRSYGDDRLAGTAVAFADGYYALAHWVDVRRPGSEQASRADE